MSFLSTNLTSRKQDLAVNVNAGPNIVTFCPVTISLMATVLGPVHNGTTFLWEQLLTYTYTSVNFIANTITVPGDITSTFHSIRELINVDVAFATVATLTIGSYLYNGTNTVLTIEQPIPVTVPPQGSFTNAGLATDSSFTWNTPTNQQNVVFTPTVFTNKQFRFWSNRGTRWQEYSDISVELTPTDVVESFGNVLTGQLFASPLPCRQPVVSVYPATPYPAFSCTDGGQLITNQWSMDWTAPTCDTSLLSMYIVQQSCNGGQTWTTIGTATQPQEFSITNNCLGRVIAVYPIIGATQNIDYNTIETTTTSMGSLVPSNIGYAGTSPLSNTENYGVYDALCLTNANTPTSMEPIISYQVSGVVILNNITNPELGNDVAYSGDGNNLNIFPVNFYQVSGVLVINNVTNPELGNDVAYSGDGNNLNIFPVLTFSVSGSVTIGG